MILTKDDIKAILSIGIDTDDHENDDFIEQVITDAQSAIESYIGQPIESAAVVYQFQGHGSYNHTLPYSRCSAIATVQTRETPVDSWASVTSTCVVARSQSPAQIYNDGGWEEGTDYRATVTVGWSTIPPEILSVAREMCVLRYNELGGGGADDRPLGVSQVATAIAGGTSTTTFVDLSSKWKQRLNQFRIIPV
jgi:hypothetical protein